MDRETAILHMILRREELKQSVGDLDEDIKAFDMAIEALEQEPTDAVQRTSNAKKHVENTLEDAISRQAAIEICNEEWDSDLLVERIEALPSVSTEKTEDYKQGYEAGYKASQKEAYITGWHDAITTALKEAYTIHHYGDIFRVVQEETLIGVGMAYEQISAEKTGRWITWKEAGNEIPSETRFECSVCHDAAQTLCNGLDLLSPYCPNCGAKMGVKE